jgi:hypothetical protein
MIIIRKLAALDLALLGPIVIISEFVVGVIGPPLLGAFIAVRGHSWGQYVMAFYFAMLGINYVPLLGYALHVRNRETAHAEIAEELTEDRRGLMRRYRRGSLLLLIPFVVPALALLQARGKSADLRYP